MTARKTQRTETSAKSRPSETRRRHAPSVSSAERPSSPAASAPDTGDIDHGWDADPAEASDVSAARRVPSRGKPRPEATSEPRAGQAPQSRHREPAPTLLELDPLQYDVESVPEPRSSQPTLPDIDPLQYDRDE